MFSHGYRLWIWEIGMNEFWYGFGGGVLAWFICLGIFTMLDYLRIK